MKQKIYNIGLPVLYGMFLMLVVGFFVVVTKQVFATHCFGSATACHSSSAAPASPDPGPTPTPYGPGADFITQCGENEVNLGNTGRGANAVPNCAPCPPNTYRVTAGDQEACLPGGQTLQLSCEPAGYTFVTVRSRGSVCCSRRAVPLPGTTIGEWGNLYRGPDGGASETWMCTDGSVLDNYESGGGNSGSGTGGSGATPTPTQDVNTSGSGTGGQPRPTPTPVGPNTSFITQCGYNEINSGNSGRGANARANCIPCPPNTFRVTSGDQEACLPPGQTLQLSCEPAGYTFVTVRSRGSVCCSRRAVPLPGTTIGEWGNLYRGPDGGASETWMCTDGNVLPTPTAGTGPTPTPLPTGDNFSCQPNGYRFTSGSESTICCSRVASQPDASGTRTCISTQIITPITTPTPVSGGSGSGSGSGTGGGGGQPAAQTGSISAPFQVGVCPNSPGAAAGNELFALTASINSGKATLSQTGGVLQYFTNATVTANYPYRYDAYGFNIRHDASGNGSVSFELRGSNGKVLDTHTISTFYNCAKNTYPNTPRPTPTPKGIDSKCTNSQGEKVVCPVIKPFSSCSESPAYITLWNSYWTREGEGDYGRTNNCCSGYARQLDPGELPVSGWGTYQCVDQPK